MDAKERIIEQLKRSGCRVTKQRLMLIDIILEGKCNCCKEIYYQASQKDPSIGPATVYRMVNTLEQIGAISRKNMYRISDKGCKMEYMIELEDGTIYMQKSGNDGPLTSSSVGSQKRRKEYAEVSLNYARSFGDHNVTALAMYNMEKSRYYESSFADVPHAYLGFVGRATYNYKSRYFLDFSIGINGSENFPKGKRFGTFPAVAVGWAISEEPFMESIRKTVSFLKIRGSYGTLGNQSVGDYQYFTTYNVYSNTYAFNNVGVGGAGFQLGTDNLQWEVSKTFNVGFDASFFRGKLNLGFDYFNKHTTDILVKPQTPLILGTELQNYNAGEMRTQGWELTLSYALKKRDWSHFFQFNIGDSWNKVLKYEGFEDISGQEEFWRITREGLPFNSYYGYKTDGFFQSYDEIAHSAVPTGKSVKPGDVKFKDRNGDGTIDENDRYYLGNAFPRYTLGFTYNVAWKGIDLSIFLQGVLKRDMMVRGELIEPFHSNYGYTMYEHQLDFWTPTNTDARWPRLTDISDPSNQNNYRMGSDLYMFDGSYLRLKNIQLGYTLPERISMKFGVKRFKIYFNAQNLLTFSNCSFIDPESSEFGSNMNSGGANSGRNYPNLRYFGAGLNITF